MSNVVENNVINMNVIREQVAELTKDNEGAIDMTMENVAENVMDNEVVVEEQTEQTQTEQTQDIDNTACVCDIEESVEEVSEEESLSPEEELKPMRMLNSSSNGKTPKQILNLHTRNELSFENLVQRSYVWEDERKSYFISSMILGYPVPPIYTAKNGKVHDVLDGQQRIKTIISFMNDEFVLTPLSPIIAENEAGEEVTIDISGLKYSELPSICKDSFDASTITFVYYNDATQEERVEMFRRINNGKPLTAKEKNIAYCNDITTAMELGRHPIFKEILTEKGLESRKYVSMIMKIWALMNMPINDVSFEAKHFNDILKNTKMTPEQATNIKVVLDYALDIYNSIESKGIKRSFKTETHLISFAPAMYDAFKKGISPALFAQFFEQFIKKEIRSYVVVTRSKTNATYSIITRNDIIMDEYDLFFKDGNTDCN